MFVPTAKWRESFRGKYDPNRSKEKYNKRRPFIESSGSLVNIDPRDLMKFFNTVEYGPPPNLFNMSASNINFPSQTNYEYGVFLRCLRNENDVPLDCSTPKPMIYEDEPAFCRANVLQTKLQEEVDEVMEPHQGLDYYKQWVEDEQIVDMVRFNLRMDHGVSPLSVLKTMAFNSHGKHSLVVCGNSWKCPRRREGWVNDEAHWLDVFDSIAVTKYDGQLQSRFVVILPSYHWLSGDYANADTITNIISHLKSLVDIMLASNPITMVFVAGYPTFVFDDMCDQFNNRCAKALGPFFITSALCVEPGCDMDPSDSLLGSDFDHTALYRKLMKFVEVKAKARRDTHRVVKSLWTDQQRSERYRVDGTRPRPVGGMVLARQYPQSVACNSFPNEDYYPEYGVSSEGIARRLDKYQKWHLVLCGLWAEPFKAKYSVMGINECPDFRDTMNLLKKSNIFKKARNIVLALNHEWLVHNTIETIVESLFDMFPLVLDNSSFYILGFPNPWCGNLREKVIEFNELARSRLGQVFIELEKFVPGPMKGHSNYYYYELPHLLRDNVTADILDKAMWTALGRNREKNQSVATD